jgi:hypothetical protein
VIHLWKEVHPIQVNSFVQQQNNNNNNNNVQINHRLHCSSFRSYRLPHASRFRRRWTIGKEGFQMGYWNLVHSERKPRKLWLVQGVSQVFESSSAARRRSASVARGSGRMRRNHIFFRFFQFPLIPSFTLLPFHDG